MRMRAAQKRMEEAVEVEEAVLAAAEAQSAKPEASPAPDVAANPEPVMAQGDDLLPQSEQPQQEFVQEHPVEAPPAPAGPLVPEGWVAVRNRETGTMGRAALSPDHKMVMLESEDGPPIALPFADFWSRFVHHGFGTPVQPSDFPAPAPGVFQQQTSGSSPLAPAGPGHRMSLGQALAGSLLGRLRAPQGSPELQDALKELDARTVTWRKSQVEKSDQAVGQLLDRMGDHLAFLSTDPVIRDLAGQIRTLRETENAEEQHREARIQMREHARVQELFRDLDLLREVSDDNLKKVATAGLDAEGRQQEMQSVLETMGNHPLSDVLEDHNGRSLRESLRKFMEAIFELFNKLFRSQDQESQLAPR